MVSYINQKKHLKKQILSALETAPELDKAKLIAELCLNTGFTEKTVKKIIAQMAELEYIEIDGLLIKRTDKTPKSEPPE